MKSGGDLLFDRGTREHVTRKLLDRELIEPHVGIESVDYPITIQPHRARFVGGKARRIGIARVVEPSLRHVLAVLRRRKQSFHDDFEG